MDGEPITVLVSMKDGTRTEIYTKCAKFSGLLKFLLEEYKNESEIQIPEVSGEQLKQIGTFLNHYKDDTPKEVPKPLPKYSIEDTYGKWEDTYISAFIDDKQAIWSLMEAANYLDCTPLLELSASKIACYIKDMTGQEIMDYFGLEEDMTDDDVKKMEAEFEQEREAEREAERQKDLEKENEKNSNNEK